MNFVELGSPFTERSITSNGACTVQPGARRCGGAPQSTSPSSTEKGCGTQRVGDDGVPARGDADGGGTRKAKSDVAGADADGGGVTNGDAAAVAVEEATREGVLHGESHDDAAAGGGGRPKENGGGGGGGVSDANAGRGPTGGGDPVGRPAARANRSCSGGDAAGGRPKEIGPTGAGVPVDDGDAAGGRPKENGC